MFCSPIGRAIIPRNMTASKVKKNLIEWGSVILIGILIAKLILAELGIR